MSFPLLVFVPGAPKPQGSKRAFVVQGNGAAKPRAVVVDSAKAPLRDWRSDVIGALRDAWGDRPPVDDPVAVTLAFFLPRPKAGKAIYPAGRVGDVDKLARTVLDAIEIAGVVTDDARVVTLAVSKFYPAPGESTGVRIGIHDLIPF